MNKKAVSIIVIIIFIICSFSLVFYIYLGNRDNKDLLTVTIHHNGAYVKETSLSCNNNLLSCVITLPKAYRHNGTVLGYSTNKNALKSEYGNEETININKNMDLYVISYQEFHVHINDDNLDYLEENNLKCYAYNENDSCQIILPLYNKIGYELKGYSLSSDSLTGYYYGHNEININKDYYLYPIYNILMHNEVINVNNTSYDSFIIEVEEGCPKKQADILNKYLKNISNKAPFLISSSKVSFLKDETFDRIWGLQYAGKTFGTKINKSLDIRCSDEVNNDYYATIVHELGHVWDYNYSYQHDSTISEQNDIINLYNKYQNSNNRPLRDYSYTDIHEFVADMVRFYYFKYIIKDNNYQNISYPQDMYKTIAKYIEISD